LQNNKYVAESNKHSKIFNT